MLARTIPGYSRRKRAGNARPYTICAIEGDRPEEAEEVTTTNTDEVDQEVRELKEKQAQLQQQLSAAADPAEAKKLEQQLAQTENELRQKDNDAYRRQNAKIS